MPAEVQTLIGYVIQALAVWGLVRFVGQVDRLGERLTELEQKLSECCGGRRRTDRPRSPIRKT